MGPTIRNLADPLNSEPEVADQRSVTPLVPAASDGLDLPESLDDLLPSNATQDRGQQLPAVDPPPAAPAPPREPTPDDIAEIAVLHDEVNEASEASERSPFGGKGRKRLKSALRAEEDALRALGFASHAEFVFATQAGALPPPQPDDVWAAPAPAPAARETLANLNTITAAPAPAPADERDPAPAELEAARDELARALAEVQRVQDELDAANAARRTSDELQARARAELEEITAWRQQADADADAVRRKLAEAEDELDRIRVERAAVATAPVTHEDAIERIRLESEQELVRIRTLAANEIEDLAAQLKAYEAETGRVAAEHEQKHRDELERFEAELRSAGEAAARAGTEATDAVRSRDAAIDELARHRTEIDKLRQELGGAAGPRHPPGGCLRRRDGAGRRS